MRDRSGNERRSRQRGSAMVEGALILVPMLAMFIGIVDVALMIFLQATFVHATREGARFAITYGAAYNGTSCTASQAVCITQVVQTNAVGFLGGTNGNLITVNYYTANDLTNPVEVCNSGTCTLTGVLPQTLSNGKIVTWANQPGNIIEVVVANYPWNWLLPISAQGYALTAPSISLGGSSLDVLGGLAAGSTQPPGV